MNTTDCPFCLDNHLLKSNILFETTGGFLIEALGSEGNYLVVPKTHAENPQDLPDDWWAHFKQLFNKVPVAKDHYNISLNVGQHAGQTVKHLHFWIIPRQPGLPSSGKGLAALVSSANQE